MPRTLAAAAVLLATPALADPLPSWHAADAKAQIVEFVEGVTDPGAESFVPEDRD